MSFLRAAARCAVITTIALGIPVAHAAARSQHGTSGLDHCSTTDSAVVCSFDVPPGTYTVRAQLGAPDRSAQTGLQVEARRTVLTPVDTRPGERRIESVTVNVRTPESMPTGEEGEGTPGLQIYVTGSAPALAGIQVAPAQHAPQLVIVSDSTASDWLVGPKRGWAQELPSFVRAGLSVANYADSGESTVTWLADPSLWATVKGRVHHGDEVLIQLAHNDKTTTQADYDANLRALIGQTRQVGGRPVLVTPPVRHLFAADGTITPTGRVVNNLGVDLPQQDRDIAASEGIPLIDLTARSQALLERLGPEASAELYLTVAHDGVNDATHFSEHGAAVMASLVVSEAKRLHLGWTRYLRECH